MSKKIQKHLDLVPFVEPQRSPSEKAEDDFEFARENIQDVISKMGTSVQDLSDVARASQHPRAYEVLDKMFRTLIDANKDLLNIQKTNEDIKEKQGRAEKPTQETHNHLHITTAELAKLLENKKGSDDENTNKD